MKHDITLEYCGIRIRPVCDEDAEFIAALRNSPHARGFIGDTASDAASQRAWLHRYYERANDWYFVIQTVHDGRAVGTLGVYDVHDGTGEWGRWILVPGVPAAAASAWLAFHCCFDVIGLETVLGHVVETNHEVLSIHRRMGHPKVGMSVHPQPIDGKTVQMVDFRATRADWPAISANLERYASMAQTLLKK